MECINWQELPHSQWQCGYYSVIQPYLPHWLWLAEKGDTQVSCVSSSESGILVPQRCLPGRVQSVPCMYSLSVVIVTYIQHNGVVYIVSGGTNDIACPTQITRIQCQWTLAPSAATATHARVSHCMIHSSWSTRGHLRGTGSKVWVRAWIGGKGVLAPSAHHSPAGLFLFPSSLCGLTVFLRPASPLFPELWPRTPPPLHTCVGVALDQQVAPHE